jgi:hypothetical protein
MDELTLEANKVLHMMVAVFGESQPKLIKQLASFTRVIGG